MGTRTACTLLLLALLSGCAAAIVQKKATDSCAAQGKTAFITSASSTTVPLIWDSASVMLICVPPANITRLPDSFGADGVTAPENLNGVGLLGIRPGSVADKAGLKTYDVVYDFGGSAVTQASQLKSAIDQTPAGDPVLIKLHRNGKDVTATAHF